MEVWRLILPELAEKIVKEVRKLMDEDIIVVNTDGFIIASTDQKRINTFHEGALIASQQKKKLIITREDQQKLKGVKAGINLPIFFQNDVIGVIGITGEPDKVTPFGEIIRKMTELLISENYYTEQFDWHSRSLETFVMDWIQLKEWDNSFLHTARILSIDMEVYRTAAIIEFSGLHTPLSRDNWLSIFNWFHLQNHHKTVAVRTGNERVVLLIDCSNLPFRTAVEKLLKHFIEFTTKSFGIQAFAGVGQMTDPKNIGMSYRQAERALKIARHKKKITYDEDLTLEMVIGELTPKIKNEFIQRTIGPILSDAEMLKTLKELFRQNHSLKNASEKLHIHINTLHYRLKKAEQLTNLNPNNIHDLMTLYLSFLFLDEQTKTDDLKL